MQPGVRINPVPGVDTPSPADAPMAQPPRKWAVSGIPNISPQFAAGRPPVRLASRRARSWPIGNQARAWLTVALPARQAGPEEAPFCRYGKGIVVRLHDEGNHRAFRPRPQVKRGSIARGSRAAVASQRAQPGRRSASAPLLAPPSVRPFTSNVPKRPIMLEPCP